jgi:hypothetical protein
MVQRDALLDRCRCASIHRLQHGIGAGRYLADIREVLEEVAF